MKAATLDDRLERLDSTIRFWKAATVVSMAVAVWALLSVPPLPTFADDKPKGLREVVAERFILHNKQGKRCAALTTRDNGEPVFALEDGKGNTRISIAMDNGDPSISLADNKETVRAQLGIKNGLSGLLITDTQGNNRMATVVSEKGFPLQTFMDDKGNSRILVGGLADDSVSLQLLSRSGKAVISLQASEELNAGLSVRDEEGRDRVAILVSEKLGTAGLFVFDKNKRKVLGLPR